MIHVTPPPVKTSMNFFVMDTQRSNYRTLPLVFLTSHNWQKLIKSRFSGKLNRNVPAAKAVEL